MAIHEIWLDNLTELVRIEGNGRRNRDGLRSVADLVGASEEYIYQLVNRKPKKDGTPRQVGKDLARKIDAAYASEKGAGWFDRPLNESDFGSTSGTKTDFVKSISEIPIRSVTQAVELLSKALIESPEWGTETLAAVVAHWAKDPTNERRKQLLLGHLISQSKSDEANEPKAA